MTVTTTIPVDHADRAPLRIGLTGGIASGKSTVAEIFAGLGAPIIDTDVIAREVVAPGMPALAQIRHEFGDQAFDEAGHFDRAAMRRIAFNDDDARLRLEGILHPIIQAETVRQARAAGGPYQVIVVPLLVKSPLVKFVDRVLAVDCDEETQVQRLMLRDGESEGNARRMLAAQSSRKERLAIADDVIRNDGDLPATLEQVRALHRKYLALAAAARPTA
jgi:dephospho-CoA kinase